MKKKILIIILIVFSSFVGVVLLYNFLFDRPCSEWIKPESVPSSAIWKGGCDGGNWIELVELKKDTIRFRVYRDWDGELILDSDFKYSNCNNFRLTESNWNEYIAYFGNTLEIYENSNMGKCRLLRINPSYYKKSAK